MLIKKLEVITSKDAIDIFLNQHETKMIDYVVNEQVISIIFKDNGQHYLYMLKIISDKYLTSMIDQPNFRYHLADGKFLEGDGNEYVKILPCEIKQKMVSVYETKDFIISKR